MNMKSIYQVQEGLRADLVRVFCFVCLPFVLYYFYLDFQYNSYIENPALISPQSYVEYMVSHTSNLGFIAFPVVIGSILLFFASFLVRKRTGVTFENQINQLKEKASFQLTRIQRFKQTGGAIYQSISQINQRDSDTPLSDEGQQILIMAAAGLAEELSHGGCANLQKEPVNIKGMLEQTKIFFVDHIQRLNVKVQIVCPENLTATADPFFTRLIFLNIFGYPLFCTQKKGEISISVTENNGYAHVAVQDHRYVFPNTTLQHFQFLQDFLVQGDKLRQLCLQNGFGYEFKKHTNGKFYTKVSIPLKDYEILENNVVSFGTLH